MTAILLDNGTITSDTAYWHDIWVNAYSTLSECVDFPYGVGGYHHIGVEAFRDIPYHFRSESAQS